MSLVQLRKGVKVLTDRLLALSGRPTGHPAAESLNLIAANNLPKLLNPRKTNIEGLHQRNVQSSPESLDDGLNCLSKNVNHNGKLSRGFFFSVKNLTRYLSSTRSLYKFVLHFHFLLLYGLS